MLKLLPLYAALTVVLHLEVAATPFVLLPLLLPEEEIVVVT